MNKNISNVLNTQGLIITQKWFELVTKTVNGQRWIVQTVCERVPGHRTSYREGAAAVCGPIVAWNDD